MSQPLSCYVFDISPGKQAKIDKQLSCHLSRHPKVLGAIPLQFIILFLLKIQREAEWQKNGLSEVKPDPTVPKMITVQFTRLVYSKLKRKDAGSVSTLTHLGKWQVLLNKQGGVPLYHHNNGQIHKKCPGLAFIFLFETF